MILPSSDHDAVLCSAAWILRERLPKGPGRAELARRARGGDALAAHLLTLTRTQREHAALRDAVPPDLGQVVAAAALRDRDRVRAERLRARLKPGCPLAARKPGHALDRATLAAFQRALSAAGFREARIPSRSVRYVPRGHEHANSEAHRVWPTGNKRWAETHSRHEWHVSADLLRVPRAARAGHGWLQLSPTVRVRQGRGTALVVERATPRPPDLPATPPVPTATAPRRHPGGRGAWPPDGPDALPAAQRQLHALCARLVALGAPDLAEKLRRQLAHAEAAPAARQPLVLGAIAHVWDVTLVPYETVRTRFAAEARAGGLGLDLYAEAVLGTPLAQLIGLTPRDATRWHAHMREHHVHPTSIDHARRCAATWLLSTLDAPEPTTQHAEVAYWCLARWRQPEQRAALLRFRQLPGPHGERYEGTLLGRLDELEPGDLCPSVVDTFERAVRRLTRRAERSLRSARPLQPPPLWWRPMRCARLLTTGPALLAEGRGLGHCVALYAPYVRRKESAIVALDVLGHRSTGPANSEPPELCARALRTLLRRMRSTC